MVKGAVLRRTSVANAGLLPGVFTSRKIMFMMAWKNRKLSRDVFSCSSENVNAHHQSRKTNEVHVRETGDGRRLEKQGLPVPGEGDD